MSDEIRVYESADFGSIRVIEEDGEFLFVASDVASTLGHREAKDMTRYLFDDEKGRRKAPTPGGEQEVAVITEAGLYHALSNRHTTAMKDPVARERVERFQRWITHEVLPSIRRTGAYLNPQWSSGGDEEGMALLSRAVVFAQHKLAELQAENDAMRPKAELADAMLGSSDTILVRELAQLLTQAGFSIGGGDLFDLLRSEGYLIRANTHDHNLPTRKSIELGLFEVRELVIDCGGEKRIKRTPRVTPKGQAYFVERYAGRQLSGMGAGDAA